MIPEGFTCYDKIVLQEGSKTFKDLFAFLKKHYNVNIESVNKGDLNLYNEYDMDFKKP